MSITSKSFLLFNTIKYLKPKQLVNQLEVRFKTAEHFWKYEKKGVKYKEFNLWVKGLDDNSEFMQRFNPEGLLDNQLTLLHETRGFDKWQYNEASHLWNFNVHYLEYLVPLYSLWRNTRDERYKEKINQVMKSWCEIGSKESDSNQAYTISLRIINQLIVSDTVDDQQKLFDSIYAQYQFLLRHQEKHLLGNHYLENLKAIVICSVVFDEDKVYKKYIRKLLEELGEEITGDGLHFELSIMYHKIVLEDLIRVAVILKQAGKSEYEQIRKTMQLMSTALYSIEFGINRTPLFNDAGDNVAKPTYTLLRVCKELFAIKPAKKDSVAGYYKIYDGRITVLFDCGELAPRYMAGHSHCDCLSFELYYDGQPVFVNSGTYQYQGDKRIYFRSTEAHNTVKINGHEQSELWGEHRAARRIKNLRAEANKKSIIGEYSNFYNERHIRKLVVEHNTLMVFDKTEGSGESFLHLAPWLSVFKSTIYGNGLKISVEPINAKMRVFDSLYASDFGDIEDNKALVFSWENDQKEHGYKIVFYEGEKKND